MSRELPVNPNRGEELDLAARQLAAALHELDIDDEPALRLVDAAIIAAIIDAARRLLDVGEFFCSECSSPVPGVMYDPQSGTVERCDACERYDGDLDAALAVAEKLGKQAWFIRHDHATDERRVTMVTAELVAGPDEGWSIESQTDPWIGGPDLEIDLTDDDGQPIVILPAVASPERAADG
jgi:hypothetical protein